MVNMLTAADYREALLLIAYHPAAEFVVQTGPDTDHVEREWRWEAEGMRAIALAALEAPA